MNRLASVLGLAQELHSISVGAGLSLLMNAFEKFRPIL